MFKLILGVIRLAVKVKSKGPSYRRVTDGERRRNEGTMDSQIEEDAYDIWTSDHLLFIAYL